MVCLLCQALLTLPSYGNNLFCLCGAEYDFIADYGFFTYTTEVYLLRVDTKDPHTS